MDASEKKLSDLPRQSYTHDEISDIYALGRMWLESGNIRKAETIMVGLNEVAPDFAAGWLGTSYIKSVSGDLEGALLAAKTALKSAPDSLESMLYVITLALSQGDFSTAGTFLGEVGERIDGGGEVSPAAMRMYRIELSRYQSRS